MTQQNKTLVDVDSLNLVSACETPFLLTLKDAAGNPIDVKLAILGSESEKVQKFTTRRINEARRDAVQRQKRGKLADVDTVEDDLAFTIEACVVRTADWEGLGHKGAPWPCTPENARLLFTRNPHFRSQVLEASGDLANFTSK